MVIKGARVSEFGGGKQLSNLSSSTLKLNPEIKECYRLRSWYDNEGSGISATNLSARGGGNYNTPWMSFRDVQDQNLGNSERGEFLTNPCKFISSTVQGVLCLGRILQVA